ncbi:hypothetical protein BT93_I1079 [Corymbia citriodora subsp. variegata]|nr:hypothetical protein BT93_I1079 [Corymbia citriodora subsp. variegata]
MRHHGGSKRRRASIRCVLLACSICTGLGLLLLSARSVDPSPDREVPAELRLGAGDGTGALVGAEIDGESGEKVKAKTCATVEEMGEAFRGGFVNESLRVRRLLQAHFSRHGAATVRDLPPDQFCRHGFVMGKASEAGFGNEMYKMLTAAALSIMLNRSLIIGQTRDKFPFGDYISYSNVSFTLREVKHLWRRNGCIQKYKRQLIMRIDDFQKPTHTNVLCSNWIKWDEPIIWFQNTTDAVAAQFFLKNIHSEMRFAATELYGSPETFDSRPNVYGELMRILISPSSDVEEAVSWALQGRQDPDITLHMRMLMNRSLRAAQAALSCVRKAISNLPLSKPRVVIVSDTPSFIRSITQDISEFAEVFGFDYKHFKGNLSLANAKLNNLDFRTKDWGPTPRWVAFVDFFLASRAKHAVVSGAHRRVGTTYVQLVAALAAANNLGDDSISSDFSFLSSFQSNLLSGGLGNQVGWGHVWNRFAGPLSCRGQPNQCAFTPLLPPAWWDGLWQSPIPRDIRRLAAYGIELSGFGTSDENHLLSFCKSRKETVKRVPVIKA